jgi:MFS family permease
MSDTLAGLELREEREGYGREFRLFAIGQAVSVVGDRIALIALVFLVIHLAHSFAPALALFYLCRSLPALAGGLIAGVLADHFDRRQLMLACDVGRALLLAAVPGVSSLGLWTVYPVVAALFALTLLFDAASTAALPDLVPESMLTGANAILRSIGTAGDLAYAVGGGLVVGFQLQLPFYIDAGTFLFSALMIFLMRMPRRQRGPLPDVVEMVTRIRQGINCLMAEPFLKWSTLAFALAPIAGGAAFVIAPLYAQHALSHSAGLIGPLKSGAFRFSVLEVALGLGGLLGSVLTPVLARRWPRGRLFGLGLIGVGASYGALAFIGNVYLAAATVAVTGVCGSLFFISGITLLQTLTPAEVRGRVTAARITVIDSALVVGSAIAGAVLLKLSYSTTWLLLGVIVASASLFIWLRPEVRRQV